VKKAARLQLSPENVHSPGETEGEDRGHGTSATGIEKSGGTKASCVGTVKPNGVSKRTSVASASTPVQSSASRGSGSWGGAITNSVATAITKAAVETNTAMRSRAVKLWRARRFVSASNCWSSRLRSIDMPTK
jgi:hypothetical protein